MKCQFIKSDGTSCGGFSMTGSEYCWRHSPDVSDEAKKTASARGGYNRNPVIYTPLPDIVIKDSRDIVHLLIDTITHLRKGEMDVRLCTAIGYLSNILLKAFILAEIETRLENLENYIELNFKYED